MVSATLTIEQLKSLDAVDIHNLFVEVDFVTTNIDEREQDWHNPASLVFVRNAMRKRVDLTRDQRVDWFRKNSDWVDCEQWRGSDWVRVDCGTDYDGGTYVTSYVVKENGDFCQVRSDGSLPVGFGSR